MSPLYGIPEAGMHWFNTYHNHHIDKLGMVSSTYDPCLMFNTDGTAIIGLQTDDSLIVATPTFMKKEQHKLNTANLLSKPIDTLAKGHNINFNGFLITLSPDGLNISQQHQTSKISLLTKDFTKA